MGGMSPNTPPYLYTDKKYFRIASKSTFLCKTYWFPERERLVDYGKKMKTVEGHSWFHCTMQIDDDVNRTKYTKKPKIAYYTHPSFGVESIEDTDMKIDILVDEKNCMSFGKKPDHFRELEPSIWQKLFN
jgi:hypothetical protein